MAESSSLHCSLHPRRHAILTHRLSMLWMRLAKASVDCMGTVTVQSTRDTQWKVQAPPPHPTRHKKNRWVEGETVPEKNRLGPRIHGYMFCIFPILCALCFISFDPSNHPLNYCRHYQFTCKHLKITDKKIIQGHCLVMTSHS